MEKRMLQVLIGVVGVIILAVILFTFVKNRTQDAWSCADASSAACHHGQARPQRHTTGQSES